nr:hypothetical protein [Tanacetum cinerariifolium]
MEVEWWVGCGDVVAVEWGNRGKGWRLVAWQGGGEMVVEKAAGCGWGLWRQGGAWWRVRVAGDVVVVLDGGSGGGLWWSGVEWCLIGDGVTRWWCRWWQWQWCWWSRWWGRGGSGGCGVEVMEAGRRVVESDIWDRIDRVTGNIFGFAENARQKSFSAAAAGDGGGWPPNGAFGFGNCNEKGCLVLGLTIGVRDDWMAEVTTTDADKILSAEKMKDVDHVTMSQPDWLKESIFALDNRKAPSLGCDALPLFVGSAHVQLSQIREYIKPVTCGRVHTIFFFCLLDWSVDLRGYGSSKGKASWDTLLIYRRILLR